LVEVHVDRCTEWLCSHHCSMRNRVWSNIKWSTISLALFSKMSMGIISRLLLSKRKRKKQLQPQQQQRKIPRLQQQHSEKISLNSKLFFGAEIDAKQSKEITYLENLFLIITKAQHKWLFILCIICFIWVVLRWKYWYFWISRRKKNF